MFSRCGASMQFRLHITKSSMYNSNFQYTQDKLSVFDICVEKNRYCCFDDRGCFVIPVD